MAIYVDVLLVTNYIVNMLLLSCHGKFTGRRMKRYRAVLAALLGAAGALTIFLPYMGFFPEVLYRFALSALIVRMAVSWRGIKAFLGDWFVFFVASFLFAGIMLALWMFIRPAGMLYANGIVYFDVSPVSLLLGMAAAYLITGVFWRFVRAGRISSRSYRMRIQYLGKAVELSAFLDSANSLYEPFGNSPVIVCKFSALRPLFCEELAGALESGDFQKAAKLGMKLRFVPYKVIKGGGVLPAFRADEILLEIAGKRFSVEDAYIAVSTSEMAHDALLHPDTVGLQTRQTISK